MAFEPKHTVLLNNYYVRRWYENIGAGSRITADVYLRTLGLYCQLNKTDPDEIIGLASKNPKRFKEEFMDFMRSLEK